MNPQTPARLTGSASMSFQNPVYVVSCASVVGKKEGEGPLGSKFDLVCEEPMFGEATWEAAESTMQKEAAALALGKAGLTPGDIRMTFAGDLLAQTTEYRLFLWNCRNGDPILRTFRCHDGL